MDTKEGDLVFVSVRGYPPWPAKVNSVDVRRTVKYFDVTFFGTQEVAKCRSTNVYPYEENKHMLGVPKKDIKFNLALEEIKKLNTFSSNTCPKTPANNKNKLHLKKLYSLATKFYHFKDT